jgi:hypothetical protein
VRPGAANQIVSVMANEVERNWTAHLVISSEHAGLKPHFKRLEAAMYHALAVIDDPRDVVQYLRYLQASSAAWLDTCTNDGARK